MSGTPKVFVVDDDELIVAMLSRALKREGYDVRGAEEAAGLVRKVSAWSPDLVMLDISLRDGSGLDVLHDLQERGLDCDVVMLTADDTASTAMKAIRLGAVDYLTKPFDLDEVKAVVRKIVENRRLKREVDYLKRVTAPRKTRDMVGESEAIVRVRREVEKLAQAGVNTVLITGDSGTGKELMARYLHRLMHGGVESADAPFLGINCAALPPNLIESELFGHEKGAFTDAKADKKGIFELAEGGSILLDEIGETPLALQTKLLRVLEERTLRRVGGSEDIPFDATVVAASNQDLGAAVKAGTFRSDLLYRLNAFSIHLPPLRERGRDVIDLGVYFLGKFAERYKKKRAKGFTREAEQALLAYGWPGNVRELRNVVERLVVLEAAGEGGQEIGVEHLPREIFPGEGAARVGERTSESPLTLPETGLSLEGVKKELIVKALEQAHNNRAQAARLLKISYDTLRYQLKKYGLD